MSVAEEKYVVFIVHGNFRGKEPQRMFRLPDEYACEFTDHAGSVAQGRLDTFATEETSYGLESIWRRDLPTKFAGKASGVRMVGSNKSVVGDNFFPLAKSRLPEAKATACLQPIINLTCRETMYRRLLENTNYYFALVVEHFTAQVDRDSDDSKGLIEVAVPNAIIVQFSRKIALHDFWGWVIEGLRPCDFRGCLL